MPLKPLILVVNDDGISAPGLRVLIDVMNKYGDVYVVAPKSAQSGMGHAITLNKPLRCDKVILDDGPQTEYSCSGTPVDCVKLAINKILTRKPDLCVSGINHGSNSSINVIYSGTMGAALEATLDGVPSVGFSLLDYSMDADFTASKEVVKIIVENILKKGITKGTCLNVNIPKISLSDLKGVRVCRQASARWIEEFNQRKDPTGRTYYWLTGKFQSDDLSENTDEWALSNGYASVVPIKKDLTDDEIVLSLRDYFNEE